MNSVRKSNKSYRNEPIRLARSKVVDYDTPAAGGALYELVRSANRLS